MFVKIDKEKEIPVTREGATPRPQRGGCDPNGEGRFPVGPRPQPAPRWGVGGLGLTIPETLLATADEVIQ